jgi:transposase
MDRGQSTLFPDRLEDWIGDDNAVLLKLYIYGYLNWVQSSRRLQREAGCNVEAMWLTSRLVLDHKTIADFRKDHGRVNVRSWEYSGHY